MKTVNLKFVSRNVASALLTMSAILLITSSTEAMSTPLTILTINADIHEAVGPKPGCLSGFGGTITGTGTSSLGDVSVAGGDCITPTSPTSFEFDHGKITFFLLSGPWSGEEIFGRYNGSLTQTESTSDSPSNFGFMDTRLIINGGTGDFEDATGRGRFSGMEDIFTGIGSLSATVKRFDFDNDRDDDEDEDEDDDKDRKKKDKGDKESDRDDKKKNSGGKEKEDDRAEKSKPDRRIAGGADILALIGGSSHTTMTTGLDSGLVANRQSAGQTIGEFFHLDKSPPQSLAINALPEVGSLSLLGIGLAGLVVARRRKPAKSHSLSH